LTLVDGKLSDIAPTILNLLDFVLFGKLIPIESLVSSFYSLDHDFVSRFLWPQSHD